MNIQQRFNLFEKKAIELLQSKFSQNLSETKVKIRWEKGKGFTNLRTGPDYESIKNFVITFRNFILDGDGISIREIAKIYEDLPEKDSLKDRFREAREKFNDFLDKPTIIKYRGEVLVNKKIIDTYIYGDVIHLEKHDEFGNWISIEPMKDLIFNEIVYILGNCGEFIYFFNNLNKEYLSKSISP